MGAEKRRYRRLDTDIEARVKDLSNPETEPLPVRIINLGPEGAFLRCSEEDGGASGVDRIPRDATKLSRIDRPAVAPC